MQLLARDVDVDTEVNRKGELDVRPMLRESLHMLLQLLVPAYAIEDPSSYALLSVCVADVGTVQDVTLDTVHQISKPLFNRLIILPDVPWLLHIFQPETGLSTKVHQACEVGRHT